MQFTSCTITRITTHGKFKDLTISIATELLPEPELPAMPIMLKSCHGGEYRTSVDEENKGEIDSMSTCATYNAVLCRYLDPLHPSGFDYDSLKLSRWGAPGPR